jgi:hypothetical protein
VQDYRGHNLVFLVGSPRSGTTWLQRLIACHPMVRTGQESDVFDTYIGPQLRAWRRELDPEVSGRGGVGLGCYLRESEFITLLREYAMKLLEPLVGDLAPGVLFVEKTPSHALYLPEIRELLPEARFIHLLRDGRDVVASLLAVSRSWGARWAPKEATSAAELWVRHVAAVRGAASGLPEEAFAEVRYEDLHARPVATMRRLANFLLLAWSDADIERAVAVNRAEQARSGLVMHVGGEIAARFGNEVKEPEGFVRRAVPGAWRSDLSRREKLAVWRVARPTLAAAGYPWSLPW